MKDQNEATSQASELVNNDAANNSIQGSDDKEESKSKKTRKRTGCFTCRRRKVSGSGRPEVGVTGALKPTSSCTCIGRKHAMNVIQSVRAGES
jgi:hypothetical protein